MTTAHRPLEGITVLDLSHMLAAPLATMMLADLGADVIKIEQPEGDHTRTVGTRGAMFVCANRNKRSVVVDLRSDIGRVLLARLVAGADVVVSAFRPGVMERLGLSVTAMRAMNPQVIVASLVGFGSTGPDHARRGVDHVLQAESGIMSINGADGDPPTKVGFQLVDAATGLAFGQAILAALLRRERFGEPSEIEVRLLDTALYLQSYQFAEMSISGVAPVRTGNSAPHTAPSDLMETADGYLVVAAYFDDQWQRLCEELDVAWMLTDERFASQATRVANRPAMLAALEGRLRTATRAHWYERLNAVGVLVGMVRTLDEVRSWDQVAVNGTLQTCHLDDGAEALTVAAPYVISGLERTITDPPRLGAHTAEVAREVGFTDAQIDSLTATSSPPASSVFPP